MAASNEQTTTSDDTHLAGNPTANDGYYTSGDASEAADSSEAQAAVDTLRAPPDPLHRRCQYPLNSLHPCAGLSPHELEFKNAMDDVVVLKRKHAELSDLIDREVGSRRFLEGILSQRKGVEDELPPATKKLATAAAKFVAAATN